MEDFELVVDVNGDKVPKVTASNKCSDIRKSWELAKKEGRLGGCGLMGSLTMDDIEELKESVDAAMCRWARLAGNVSFRIMPNDPIAREIEMSGHINELTDKLLLMEKELKLLRKQAENDKSAIDRLLEEKAWVDLVK